MTNNENLSMTNNNECLNKNCSLKIKSNSIGNIGEIQLYHLVWFT